MSDDEIKLSEKDRLLLINQYLILEKLYPDEAVNFKKNRIIIQSGYEIHYRELFSYFIDNGLSKEESNEVMDILDMYRALNDSYKKLKDKEGINPDNLIFEGFDGNNNYRYLDYARYLVVVDHRWQEVVINNRPDFDFNSHFDNLDIYRRMVNTWSRLDRKFNLSKEGILEIIDSRINPENHG